MSMNMIFSFSILASKMTIHSKKTLQPTGDATIRSYVVEVIQETFSNANYNCKNGCRQLVSN